MNIYRIENKENGKIYIGQTKQAVLKRVYMHSKRESHIGNALRKYGLHGFDISVIDTADTKEALDEKEKHWIRHYDCRSPKGYNFTDGGDGLNNPTEETRQKMSATKRANPCYPSAESRKKMSIASKGKPKSEVTKQKMRKPKSEEHRQNIKIAHARPEVKKKHIEAMMGNRNWVRRPHNDSMPLGFL